MYVHISVTIIDAYALCYGEAAAFFYRITPFFGENGWSLLELSMLVLYCTSLKELNRKDEYVRVLLKLLTKASAAQLDKTRRQTSSRLSGTGGGHIGGSDEEKLPEDSAVSGYLP